MPRTYRSAEFFRALPAQLRPRLPAPWRRFDTRLRNWMLQVYYDEYNVHYEASAFPKLNVFEVGLHFERRGKELNDALMQHVGTYVIEIKAELGTQIEFERWDKGWSKIYETLPLAPYDDTYLARVAERMAKLIACLQPILTEAP
ncbi:MAG: hypothetical protein ABI874_05765 [Chloroflexota bacterium]